MTTSPWFVNRQAKIGTGGFGQVFAATDPNGNAIAAKVLPRLDANRDLLVQDLAQSDHIVPVLHVEEVGNEVILFMPRAEMSLRDRVLSPESIGLPEAVDILTDVAAGLAAMGSTIVHRDLKPENILLLGGKWAICDFGISRYAESSTAADTRKFSMTPPYASPEQWRHEHATAAADVYALGVIAHELLSGERPFPGPSIDDYRRQHLEGTPPLLVTTKRLASIVTECLFKSPEARPTASNLLARLAVAGDEASSAGASALAEANQMVVESIAASQRAAESARTQAERRASLFEAARLLFGQIVEELLAAVEDGAPTALVIRSADGGSRIELGQARVDIASIQRANTTEPYDVVAYSSITLRSSDGKMRSHSLYYANFEDPVSFRWYELAFSSTMRADFEREPRAVAPAEAAAVFERVFGTLQLGRPIEPLDTGDLTDFVDAWSKRIGETAVGRFPPVYQLPEGNPMLPNRSRG